MMKVWEISLLNKLYNSSELFRPLESLFLSENLDFLQARKEIFRIHDQVFQKSNVFQLEQIKHEDKIEISNHPDISLGQEQLLKESHSQNKNKFEFITLKYKLNNSLLLNSSIELLRALETTTKKQIINPEDDLETILTICNYLTYKDLFEYSFSFVQILDQMKVKDQKLFISEGFEYIDVLIFSALGRCRSWKAIVKEARTSIPSLISWFEWIKNEHKDITLFHTHPSIQSKKDQKQTKHKQLFQNYNKDFITAIRESDFTAIQKYLDSGVSIECIDPNDKKKTACHIACENGNIELVKLLIEKGCNLEALDAEGMTPIFYALSNENLELIELLTSLGINLEHGDCQDRTPFYWASSTCSISIVQYLYKKGCKIDIVSKMNRSPLSKSAYTGRTEIVEFLLTCPEVQVNEEGERGRTALQMAVWGKAGGRQGKKVGHKDAEDSPEIARILLKNGANINQKDHEGNTALHTASSSYAEASIPILMEFGADVNSQNNAGETPLFRASEKGYLEICRLLIEKFNADPSIKCRDGLDCLEISIKNKQYLLTLYFLEILIKRFDQDDVYFDHICNLISINFQKNEAKILLTKLFKERNKSIPFFFSLKTLENIITLKDEELLEIIVDWLDHLLNSEYQMEQEDKLKGLIEYGFQTKWLYCLQLLDSKFQPFISKLVWKWTDISLEFDTDDLVYLLQTFNVNIFSIDGQSGTLLHYLVKTKNAKLLSSITQFLTLTLQTVQALNSYDTMGNVFLKKIDLPFIIGFLNTKNESGHSASEMALIHKNYGASTILEQLVGQKLKNLLIIPSYELLIHEEFDRAHKQKELLIEYETKLEEADKFSKAFGILKGKLNNYDQEILKNSCEHHKDKEIQHEKQNYYEKLMSQRKVVFIDDEINLNLTSQKLSLASIIGVDMECYSDENSKITFVCLLQISTVTEDYLFDCLKLHALINQYLSPIFIAENILKVFHGCDNDLKWLKSNFDIDVINLFDTSRAYMLLTNDTVSLGLSTLTLKFLGFELNKSYQKADWRVRPLPKVMKEYARGDSCVLLYLWYLLDKEIKSKENGGELEIQLVSKMLRKCWKTLEEGSLQNIKVLLKNG